MKTQQGAEVQGILDELRGLGSEKNRAGMARYGIRVDQAYGVPVPALRGIAKRLGRSHALALALWATGVHEARHLAGMVDEPALVTEAQLEAWVAEFDSWDVCDGACNNLFRRTPFGWAKAVEWSTREDEWVRRAGFVLVAVLAVHDKTATDQAFLKLLPVIERAASDERPFVHKAVNWALRQIGKRNRALNVAAIVSAERIRAAANKRAGGERGGDAAARAARWVAVDALRELSSPKIQARLRD